ncbi:MAG: hypothetical protein RL711_1809 [Bacteroidota bacterium]
MLEIKTAKYRDANLSLENSVDNPVNKYNKALASLLNKDYDNAKKAFDEAILADPNNALAYYGAAVTAANQSNIDFLSSRLAKAVKLDSNLKGRAVSDLEFKEFWNVDSFKDALK